MNWNKVVNMLLILFLAINVMLFGYQQFYQNRRYTLTEERAVQLQSVMDSKGINMFEYIPKHYPKSQFELEAPSVDKEMMKQNILGSVYKTQIDENSLGERVYTSDQSLTFYVGEQDGYVYYKSEGSHYVPANLTLSNVESAAMQFAEDLFGEEVKMEMTYRKSVGENGGEEKGYRIELNERFEERGQSSLVFQTFIKLHITADGIKEALAVRYKPVGYVGENRNIYPFDEAMYSLMYYLEDDLEKMVVVDSVLKKTIKHIEIGYYLVDVDWRKYAFRLDPYYRIIFDDGETYYINAYTSDISKP